MVKRMNSLLKRTWDRNRDSKEAHSHITLNAPKSRLILEAKQCRGLVTTWMGDQWVCMSARSGALANLARRAFWLKTWQGNSVSKVVV